MVILVIWSFGQNDFRVGLFINNNIIYILYYYYLIIEIPKRK